MTQSLFKAFLIFFSTLHFRPFENYSKRRSKNPSEMITQKIPNHTIQFSLIVPLRKRDQLNLIWSPSDIYVSFFLFVLEIFMLMIFIIVAFLVLLSKSSFLWFFHIENLSIFWRTILYGIWLSIASFVF